MSSEAGDAPPIVEEEVVKAADQPVNDAPAAVEEEAVEEADKPVNGAPPAVEEEVVKAADPAPDNVDTITEAIPHPISFRHIECWAPGKKKQILHGVSGYVKPGQMLAVMGPSGSGKTTMLNVLSKKIPANLTAGTIKIGANNVTKKDRARMGFVFQDDLMLSNLSVRETIMTSAQLKLPVKMPTAEKAARVSSLIDILGLSKVAEHRIGSIGIRGISGGERKRTAVGNELVTSPSVLFLDEPTSGLDSTTALQLVQTLRKLCDGGMTIICCIHQPRENIFSLFDQLLLLADGRTAYFGPAAGCGEYLESLSMPSGEKLSLPPFTTVADWILDLMSKEAVASHIKDLWTQNENAAVEDAVAAMRGEVPAESDNAEAAASAKIESEAGSVASPEAVSGHKSASSGNGVSKALGVIDPADSPHPYPKTSSCGLWCHKFSTLSRRDFMQKRGHLLSPPVVVNVLVTAIVCGLVYWQVSNARDLLGLLFFLLINQGYLSASVVMRLFPAEKFLMLRERSSKYYPLSAYFLAKCCVDAVTAWASPIIFMTIVYWCGGLLPDAGSFFMTLGIFITFIIACEGLGLMLSCAFGDFGTAAVVNNMYILASMLVSGFYVSFDLVPVWLVWLKYLGIMTYAYAGLLRIQLDVSDPTYPCSFGREGQYGACYVDAQAENPTEVAFPNGTISGESILDFYGTPDIHPGACWAILLVFAVVFRLIAYLFLRFGTPRRANGGGCCGGPPQKRQQQQSPKSLEQESKKDPDRGEDSAASTEKGPVAVELTETAAATEPRTSTVRKQLTNIDVSDGVEEVSIDFSSLGYEVPTRPPRRILNNISGHIEAGTLVAMMGPSGAGKTTLLNALAQRDSGGKQTPETSILYNGHPSTAAVKSRCGFVFQDDLMLSMLTVRETIMVAAELKLPPNTTKQRKIERVENVIDTLGLSKVANSRIGGMGMRGISGGERKRTALATELITSPSILFLDEPTTGLDSHTALEVVHILKDLCLSGMTVICSIHQPRSSIFQTFDTIFLLSQGETAYFGPVDGIVKHMEEVGLPGCKLPAKTNVADWILDLLENDDSSEQIVRAWNDQIKLEDADRGGEQLAAAGAPLTAKSRPNCCHQFAVLIERIHKQEAGQLFAFVGGFSTLILAVVAGGVWWQSRSILSLAGAPFFLLLNQSFMSVIATTRVFPPQRNLMLRETSLGYYGVIPYFLAQNVYDSAMSLLIPTLFAIIFYLMAGLELSALAFFTMWGVLLLTVVTAQSLGLFIACSIMDVATTSAVTAVVILFFMLLGGFYVSAEGVLAWLSWIKYLSFIYWGYSALMINEFGNGRPDIVDPSVSEFGVLPCEWANDMEFGPCFNISSNGTITANATYPHGYIYGSTVLDIFGFGDNTISFCCAALAILAVGWRILACLALWAQTQPCCAYGCCRKR